MPIQIRRCEVSAASAEAETSPLFAVFSDILQLLYVAAHPFPDGNYLIPSHTCANPFTHLRAAAKKFSRPRARVAGNAQAES